MTPQTPDAPEQSSTLFEAQADPPAAAPPSSDPQQFTLPAKPREGDAERRQRESAQAPAPRRPQGPTISGAAATAERILREGDMTIDEQVNEAMMGFTDADLKGAADAAPTTTEDPVAETLLTGRIANIGTEDVLIDFGVKSLGVMPRAEFEKNEHYDVGQPIEVLVVDHDARRGLLTVSRRKAKQAALLRDLKTGMVVEGVVSGMNKGGLEVDVEGLRAFVPASQVSLHFVKDISGMIGQSIKAQVTRFDRDDKNLVLSRRKVEEREEAENQKRFFETLEIGQVLEGRVKNLAEFGAFVDLGGADGLLHISDMSWARIKKPDEVVKLDDRINVKVIKLNREKRKISLSLREAMPNPWDSVEVKYTKGLRIAGKVVRLQDFGAFVELEPGVEGLLPLAELSWTRRVRHPKEILHEGDAVEVAVVKCEPDKKRISLSLKQLIENPWNKAAEKYAVGSRHKGKVVRTTEFGAFVQLEDGIDGLVHISEVCNERIRAVTDRVKPGDEVEVRVLGVDSDKNKISLSMKAPPPEPTAEEIAQIQAEREEAEKRRANRPKRGGITFGWDNQVLGLGSLDPSKFAR